ncbi:hypothetical protein FF001_19865 [Leptospira interrogans]|nr:hypothetical protein FF001_19865 [Leptospira interrogans]
MVEKILYSKVLDHILSQTFNKKGVKYDLTSIFCAIDDYCTKQKINWNEKILSPVIKKAENFS